MGLAYLTLKGQSSKVKFSLRTLPTMTSDMQKNLSLRPSEHGKIDHYVQQESSGYQLLIMTASLLHLVVNFSPFERLQPDFFFCNFGNCVFICRSLTTPCMFCGNYTFRLIYFTFMRCCPPHKWRKFQV